MKIDGEKYLKIIEDLGLKLAFIKGQTIPIRNCWHFCTDGDAIDFMFCDEEDFTYGMNLIYVLICSFDVVVLAFCLMNTHIHFIIYGEFDTCNRMMHEYLRRLSIYLSRKQGAKNKLRRIPLTHQPVVDDLYLKTVICYTVKNPPSAGLPFFPFDYPWSSGALYFRPRGMWTSPAWLTGCKDTNLEGRRLRDALHLQEPRLNDPSAMTFRSNFQGIKMVGNLICPSEYVAVDIVERLFRTHKGYSFFINQTRDIDVESKGGSLSYLSIPLSELRQHKTELCRELFGAGSIKELNIEKRIRLARVLKSRYLSSSKQIARVCGLVFDEVRDKMQ